MERLLLRVKKWFFSLPLSERDYGREFYFRAKKERKKDWFELDEKYVWYCAKTDRIHTSIHPEAGKHHGYEYIGEM